MSREIFGCRSRLLLAATTAFLTATTLMAGTVRDRAELRGQSPVVLAPVAADPVMSTETLADLTYQQLKNLGAPAGMLELVDTVVVGAENGHVDESAIWSATQLVPSPEIQAKADTLLRALAESVMSGFAHSDIVGFLPATQFDAIETEVGMPGRIGNDLNVVNPSPKLAGTCLTCPNFNFGPFTPTTTYQFHASSTSSSGDCNWYAFTVVPGRQYEFTTCSPGSGFDTRIEVVRGDTCACLPNEVAPVAGSCDVDDSCGLQTRYTVTAPAGVTSLRMKLKGFSTSFGSYNLAYRETVPCKTCANPKFTAVPDPTPACQSHSTSIDSCNDNYYRFNLVSGTQYEFSTCSNLGCPGAAASFDTVIEARNPSCTLTNSNDDAAGCAVLRSSFLAFTPTVSGVWSIRVRPFSTATTTGTYTLTYRSVSGCQTPNVITLTPTTGNTNQTNCSITQQFTGTVLGTQPFTGTFTITPPAGGSASPSSGAVTFTAGTGRFTSTLTKSSCGSGNFTVAMTATNACGSNTRTITYVLSDRTAPTFSSCPTSFTQSCSAPVPPPPTVTATDNCDPAPTVTFTQTTVQLACPGNRNIVRTWVARDCSGNSRTCTQTISLRDTTPPSISGLDTSKCLHPPNHEYHCYSTADFSPTISDDCSLPGTFVIVGCASDEPDNGTGDGDHPNDCIVSASGNEVCMRAERAGNLNDRHYAILGVAIDACGNRSAPTPIAVVTVPHDDSEHPECDAGDGGLER